MSAYQGLPMFPGTTTVVIKTNLAGYYFDAILSSQHESSLTVTAHPVESGAAISDHAFVNPRQLTLQIGMSDAAKDIYPGQFEGGPAGRSVTAYRLLCDLQKSRIPVKVLTRLGEYDNMVIESVSASDDNKTAFGLRATVTLREILVAVVTTVKVSSRPHVTDSTERGAVEPKKLPQSWLSQGNERLFGTPYIIPPAP